MNFQPRCSIKVYKVTSEELVWLPFNHMEFSSHDGVNTRYSYDLSNCFMKYNADGNEEDLQLFFYRDRKNTVLCGVRCAIVDVIYFLNYDYSRMTEAEFE